MWKKISQKARAKSERERKVEGEGDLGKVFFWGRWRAGKAEKPGGETLVDLTMS